MNHHHYKIWGLENYSRDEFVRLTTLCNPLLLPGVWGVPPRKKPPIKVAAHTFRYNDTNDSYSLL
jgi:hypothetical protein